MKRETKIPPIELSLSNRIQQLTHISYQSTLSKGVGGESTGSFLIVYCEFLCCTVFIFFHHY